MLPAVLFICLLLALVAGVLRLLMHVRSSSLVEEPICANCHYIIHALASSTCPECGATLTPRTILQPHQRRPIPFAPRLLAWSAFVGLLALLLLGPWGRTPRRQLDAVLPVTHGRISYYILSDSSDTTVHFSLVGSGRRPVPAPHQMILWRNSYPADPHEPDGLVIDLKPLTARTRTGTALSPSAPLSREQVVDYLSHNGLPAAEAHATALLALARAARDDRPITPLLLEDTRMRLLEQGYSACITRYDRLALGTLLAAAFLAGAWLLRRVQNPPPVLRGRAGRGSSSGCETAS